MSAVRSVFIFSAVDIGTIRVRLDSIAERGPASTWFVDGGLLWLRVDERPNWSDGFEHLRAPIEAVLGADVKLVSADVSSRIVGSKAARSFALAILELGPGLAFDDDAEQGWTSDQIAADELLDGRKFFSGPHPTAGSAIDQRGNRIMKYLRMRINIVGCVLRRE
jgi:hypothetical protein